MSVKNTIVLSLFFGGLTFAGWKILSAPAEIARIPRTVIVLDRSDSLRPDIKGKIIAGLLNRAVRRAGLTAESTVSIVVTGDETTDYEPVSLPAFLVPVPTRILESVKVIERRRRDVIATEVNRYLKTANETKTSPIFSAVKRALEHLKAEGCAPGNGCELYTRSDGEETELSWLRDSLKAGKALKTGKPPVLDNSVAKVFWCGLAETRGELPVKGKPRGAKRTGPNPDLVKSLWSSSFADPEAVTFEPFCPQLDEPR